MDRSLLDNVISILMGAIVLYSFFLSYKPALRSLKSVAGDVKIKPRTWLQAIPKLVTTITLVLVILGIFNIGTFETGFNYDLYIRTLFLFLFALSIYLQVKSFRDLGVFYTQDIVLFGKQKIIDTGIYRYLRHPAYFFQFISSFSAAIALESYLIMLFFLLIELPILIMRSDFEEDFLLKHCPNEYKAYSQSTLKWIPYILPEKKLKE